MELPMVEGMGPHMSFGIVIFFSFAEGSNRILMHLEIAVVTSAGFGGVDVVFSSWGCVDMSIDNEAIGGMLLESVALFGVDIL